MTRISAISPKRTPQPRTATPSASFRPLPAVVSRILVIPWEQEISLCVLFKKAKLKQEQMGTAMATSTRTEPDTKPVTGLSKEEILRYSRHLIMPEVGMEGQLKLKNAKVLLIGTGGLGAPLGLY